MLRPANDALKHHKLETTTTIAVLAISLLIPCLMALSAAFLSDGATQYLTNYHPMIYLAEHADQAQADQLADELQGWVTVGAATVRSPDAAFERLQARLGEQQVNDLGISPKMLPWSVELVPALPVLGHLDLVAATAGLAARPIVATVDLPAPQATRILATLRWLFVFGVALTLLLLAAGVAQTRILLGHFHDFEASETMLLRLFGAPPARLRRATLTRGVTVGVVAGIVSFCALLLAVFLWHLTQPILFGLTEISLGWAWLILFVPLVLGPAAGFLAAGLLNRRGLKQRDVDALELQILV